MSLRNICKICSAYLLDFKRDYKKCVSCGFTIHKIELSEDIMRVSTFEDAEKRYGKIENMKWADEAKWMVLLAVPDAIKATVKNSLTGKPLEKIYCNKDAAESLKKVFNELISTKHHTEIKTFDGCFNIRYVRGSTDKLSTHSYGLAIDMNAKDMPLGSESKWTKGFVEIWKKNGWTFGGDFKRLDPQHWSYCWE